ncbi:extracellular solute-binding protein [Pedobacter heparinus]|uniref:Extracellular solute-binding protein family 1 n=1 Tax=Pedobacter heparinus (strain ATCC 13125 / DSM 2366 / CIP 104194 / JCM 7457 / NBRC 12017 / NCIMB 9290 / NRRL B-14731 / HIM 762-3) TaxID=485917 RepID=C6Y127_PEDHD|nr:extracellular solute-binding protein [Pedobacter heparinus]ACU04954.1 extracellular solute-binding protein family 1 [Pedobacter heparinus DSM 2366]
MNKEAIRIAVRKFAPFEAAMQKVWDSYCMYSGCTLQAELVPLDLHELHKATLGNDGLKKGEWDIAHINTDWLLEGYASEAFEILNPHLDANAPSAFPEGWSPSLLALQQFEEQVVGLPFHDGPECLSYRKDLFDDVAEQQRYLQQYRRDLKIPATWDEFRQVASFFYRPEQNLYGSVFACYPDGHNTVFDFCLQLWSRGGTLLDEEGKINIDTKAAAEGLDFYRQLLKDTKAVHPGSANYDSVQAGQAFARGEAALMINWFGFASVCEVDAASAVKGKVGVTSLPVSENNLPASLNVYWVYTIGSGSKHKQTAYDFLRFAVNEENDKQLTLEGGIGCRISTWKDSLVNELVPYYHKLEQLHKGAKTLPQKSNWAEIAAIIDVAVLKALNSELPAAEILRLAQEQIILIDK